MDGSDGHEHLVHLRFNVHRGLERLGIARDAAGDVHEVPFGVMAQGGVQQLVQLRRLAHEAGAEGDYFGACEVVGAGEPRRKRTRSQRHFDSGAPTTKRGSTTISGRFGWGGRVF